LSEHALDRTILLLQRDYLPTLERRLALETLASMRVALLSDDESLRSNAGVTAHRTASWALTAMGLPPVARGADYTISLGAAPAGGRGIRIAGASWHAAIGEDQPWRGNGPFGGILGGVLAGASAFRLIIERLAARLGEPPPRVAALSGSVRLPSFEIGPVALGSVDVISAGAITNSAFYTLMRWPGLAGEFRVFDDDRAEITNLNRYPLLSVCNIGAFKTDIF
jgi:hypothetical protein